MAASKATNTMRRRSLVAFMCFAAFLHACGYAKGRPFAIEGRLFPSRLVNSLEKGMTAAEVMGVVGEPLEKTRVSSSKESWRYFALHRQDEEVIFLGRTVRRIPYYIVESEAILSFKDGLLEDVLLRERTVDPGMKDSRRPAVVPTEASPSLPSSGDSRPREDETTERRAPWPPRIEADCEVGSTKIPYGVLRETWGYAALEADFYVFGCRQDIEQLLDTERILLEKEARAMLREYEGTLYWAQDGLATRRLWVARLNKVTQREVILDLRVRDMRHLDF